jgi:hypothetical protein
MAGSGAKGKIGEAYIEITADTAKAQQGLKDTERATKEMADKGEKSLKGYGDAIDKNTEGVRKLTGAVGSVVGVYTQMLGVVGLVVTSVGGLVAALKRLSDTSEEVVAKTNALNEALFGIEAQRNISKMNTYERERNEIFRKYGELVDQTAGLPYEDAQVYRRELERLLDIELAELETQERIRAEVLQGDNAREQALKAQQELEESAKREAEAIERGRGLTEGGAARTRAMFAEAERMREFLREQEKARIEMERKAAKAFAEALERELRDIQLGQFGGTLLGDSLTAPIQETNHLLRQIRAGTRRL